MKKRTLCLLLAWIMALSLMPFEASAGRSERTVCVGWTFRESTHEDAVISTSDPDKVMITAAGKTVVKEEWTHDYVLWNYDIVVLQPGTYEIWIEYPGDEGSRGEDAGENWTITLIAREHEWSEWEQKAAPTCTAYGKEIRTCANDASHTETRSIDPLGHSWSDWEVTAAPSCTKKGTETRTCQNDASHVTTRSVKALGHSWGEWEVTTAPTCTKKGVQTRVCTNDASHVQTRTIAATGHNWSDWEEVVAPTTEKQGVSIRSCTVCGETDVRSIPRLQPEPTPTPTVTPTPTAAPEPTAEPKCKFKDVKKDAYYYDAVAWAVNRDPVVTTGTDETHFSPGKVCARAQMVTFLWRAAGEPKPESTKNPFKDVKKGAYYYNAVLWAVGEGITNGTGKNTFSPDATVTRAQTVTFLWRMEHEPAVKAKNPFRDVKSGQYYFDAVLWAVKNDITNGKTVNTFAPGDPCTRAQIVTFLYRDIG